MYRRADLFDLRFDLYNLKLVTSPKPALVRIVPSARAYLVVVFPFQQVAEEAVLFGGTTPPPWPVPPMNAIAPGPSQLVFSVPSSLTSISFDLTSLLDWTKLAPVLVPVAIPLANTLPSAPGPLQTFIEAPWQLFLSPGPSGTWSHSSKPVAHSGRVELWQTRLGVHQVEPPASKPTIRAVWTPSWPDLGPADPFTMSLENTDRRDLVTLSSGGPSQTGAPVTGIPIPAKLFMLTPLGASLDLEGSWNEPFVSSITDWRHKMTTGRDSYVRVVRSGYVYPFGHRAVLIKVTDREFQVSPSGDVVAYLVQRYFVQVTQPTRTYNGTSPEPFGGRANPLRQVTITTLVTPPIDLVDAGYQVPGVPPDAGDPTDIFAIWVRASGTDVQFSMSALDFEGHRVDFSTPLIWVDESQANSSSTISLIETEYSSLANLARRQPDLGGQLLSMASTAGGKPGSTAQHAESIELDGAYVASPLPGSPSWYPVLASAVLRLPAAEQIVGAGASGLSAPKVGYPLQYLTNGFQSGLPEVFLEVLDSAPGLTFPANLAGGMATPNFSVGGLARDLGPVGDAAGLLAGTFDPSTFFAGLDAKILGAVNLADIIAVAIGGSIVEKAPKIASAPVYPSGDSSKPPRSFDTTVDWTPIVQGDAYGFFQPTGDKSKTLGIKVKISTPVANPSATTYDIDGQLVDFNLNLFGQDAKGGLTFITVHFKKAHFTAKTGAKANVDVLVDTVKFAGPLTFVNELEKFFASLGGPSIDLQPSGVTASYSLPLPSIGVGVFAIENIKLTGGLTIPFDGTPVRLRVSFCTRDAPFLLSISLFTGGGFFGIGLGADGIELIEVSLEFGASCSMDLGVASGGVSIMAGIYFKLASNTSPPPSDVVTLTGFLQASGNLEVLGIISISIVFYLGFTYVDPGKCTGTASVTVTVKVLFFAASVNLTVTKTFGGGGDPTFAQAISQADWDTYCEAFAA